MASINVLKLSISLSEPRRPADWTMHDIGPLQAILDLTSLDVGNGFGNILVTVPDFGLGIRPLVREPFKTTNNAHHVRSGDNNIIIKPVLRLNLGNHLFRADKISARLQASSAFGPLQKPAHAWFYRFREAGPPRREPAGRRGGVTQRT